MDASTELIAFYEDLSARQAEELRAVLATDPSAAELLRSWRAVRAAIRRDLETAMVDREVFALYVLGEAGRDAALTAEDRRRLQEAAPIIREALRRRPSLAAIAGSVHTEAEIFEALWSEWFGAESGRDDRPDRGFRDKTRRRDRASTARRSRSGRWAVRAGIGAAVIVFAALLLLVGRRDGASVTVATASGEMRLVELGDGSSVRMLGGSRLSYVPRQDASPLDRQAEFEGRGFFEIAEADRGYVVKTPNAQAVVLGTSFGVRTADEQTEVVLAEGRLALSARDAPDQTVDLAPGQMSRVAAGGGPSAPLDVRVHDRLAWTGLFVFQAAPLRDILAQLSRFYDTEVTADDALLDEEVTGRFEQGRELPEILDVIASAVGARLRPGSEGFHITSP